MNCRLSPFVLKHLTQLLLVQERKTDRQKEGYFSETRTVDGYSHQC